MQVNDLSHVKPDVDYTQILPIQQKRIIAFVNHFVTNTVSYLNNFCQSCESRFMEFEYKLQKTEASLLILESQLSSIPGFDKKEISVKISKEANNNSDLASNPTLASKQLNGVETVEVPASSSGNAELEANVNTATVGIKACQDPRFAKFFKMVRVGVHEEAVKLKMQREGFDPTILDNPDAIIPDFEEKS